MLSMDPARLVVVNIVVGCAVPVATTANRLKVSMPFVLEFRCAMSYFTC